MNVKYEIFISELDKENARVPFSDKDLSEIRNAMSEDIFNTDNTSRGDSRYTSAVLGVLDPDRAQPS